MDKSDAQILREAAALIEQPGAWMQGHYSDVFDHGDCSDPEDAIQRSSCFCGLGAIWKITADECHMVTLCNEVKDRTGVYIPTLNDANGATAQQVASFMREAADKLDAIPAN